MDNNNQNRNGGKRPSGQNIGVLALILVITLIAVTVMNNMVRKNQTQELGYEEFVEYLKEGEIDTAKISSNRIYLTPKTSSTKLSRFIQYYTVRIPDVDLAERLLDANGVHVVAEDTSTSASILNFLMGWVLPSALMIGLLYMMYSRMGGGGMMGVGKSNAKVYVQKETGVTFADVAGEDEAKESLVEIVDFLHNPQKYSKIGAKLPKGALLVGPPGTGKTLLAKAVAGEAHVPFYSLSGSDFVEMFVGVGASRVRDLFKQAQQSAPCIIFIDEIDAVARRRGTGMGGGHDEREQTLNQLLVEMDGFGVNEGIIVMAATNRVDILDPAILRPGRFDRRVVVGPPDVMGREEILKVHAKNKPLAEDVDLKQIAQTTAGFTGAELENLLNEAAIMAAKDRRRFVRQADIKSAFIKVGIGAEKRSKVISDKEKRITAYHETGHAILFHMLPDMEAVYTISIIPTGPGAAGYTMPQPENDDMFQTRGKMMQYITVCLGGRVAEELIFDDITTGASQDIKQATATARSMITKYGMSENLGLVAYDSDSDEVFIGRDWGHTKSYSENVAAAIDEEVRQMIEKCHDQAKQIILEHSYVLHECAKQLMEKEKLSRAEFEAIFEQEAQMTGTAPEVSGEI